MAQPPPHCGPTPAPCREESSLRPCPIRFDRMEGQTSGLYPAVVFSWSTCFGGFHWETKPGPFPSPCPAGNDSAPPPPGMVTLLIDFAPWANVWFVSVLPAAL